ncbi:hypothetical protein ABB02_00694 [Clostridiaceae bacterium JG1575]|nr:hypothetical protein ABB02_00694 [Clostridiaceae bacterium JG1575]
MNGKVIQEYSQEILQAMDGYKSGRGTHYFKDLGIFAVFMGERSTGGYSLELAGVAADHEGAVICVQEDIPGPDAIVTQAFTYPMLLLEWTGEPPVRVCTKEGELFQENPGGAPRVDFPGGFFER